MKHIITRFLAETPSFFKRLAAFGASLSATATAVIFIPNIPATMHSIVEHMIWVGAVIAAVSKLTCKNPDDLKK